jgi:phospholipase/carboxylesterase
MNMQMIESGRNPRYAMIWLHGLGADGSDFMPVADELQLPAPVRHLFPDAPKRPVTINGGFIMRAWYDIVENQIQSLPDAAGIEASRQILLDIIAQQVAAGIPHDHIFVAGFSQGGAIALHSVVRLTTPLAGVLALSTYLPMAKDCAAAVTTAGQHTPIFMAHGRSDPIVPHTLGLASRDTLLAQNFAIAWHEYPMPHSVCPAELRDIQAWLAQRMAA